MKFIIKTGIDIVVYIFAIQISNLIVLGGFAIKGILGNVLVSILSLLVLYCINISFDEITFLKVSKVQNVLSLTLSSLILALYFLCKVLLFDYSDAFETELDTLYLINYLIIVGLSILLNIILKRFKIEV